MKKDTIDNEYNQALINSFINRSFRDVADCDYISARILFRNKLFLQFYWFAEQAIEKYIKAILLYNNISAKEINHDILKGIKKIKDEICDISFLLPDDVISFLDKLNDFGCNRYLEITYTFNGDEILILDKTVWHIRKYCRYLRERTWFDNDNTLDDYFMLQINNKVNDKFPNNYNIFDGYLENVINNKRNILRKELIWINFYYGKNKKRKIQYMKVQGSVNSSLAMNPEIYEYLKDKIKFSKDIKEYFENINKE
jgi:HEPN domain-containing protein